MIKISPASSGIRPHIGVRARLFARGAGKCGTESSGRPLEVRPLGRRKWWRWSSGCAPKTCSTASSWSTSHIGSQITAIRAHKDALREAGRIFAGLHEMGATPSLLDVGGGLGVDYDGSQTNFHSSMNYSVQEYANDVVAAVQEACDDAGIPSPGPRHRGGPGDGRPPLRARLRRARCERDALGPTPAAGGRWGSQGASGSVGGVDGHLAQERPGGLARRPPDQGGGLEPLLARLPRPARARSRGEPLLGVLREDPAHGAGHAAHPRRPPGPREGSSPTPTTGTSRSSSRRPTTGRCVSSSR